jgi:hypothetical protein
MTLEQCAESLINFGMCAILDGLWKPHDANTLIEPLQGLAERCPEHVYPYLAEVLQAGERIRQEQEREAPVLGFRTPSVDGPPES